MKTYSNLQEVYDTAVAGLASQNFQPSYTIICSYRGLEGHKCAIGWCIPDEIYSPEMEGRSVDRLLDEQVYSGLFAQEIRDLFAKIDTATLSFLQSCHDSSLRDGGLLDKEGFPERLRARLRNFGEVRNLQVPAVLTE